ncbi:hypothetical protein HOC32_00025 [Candidatus Woesearchaeota archaeon]|jgi:hypothetical protein|nr:hypothetical protein [Candidatus Woesearchaeota archaeon]
MVEEKYVNGEGLCDLSRNPDETMEGLRARVEEVLRQFGVEGPRSERIGFEGFPSNKDINVEYDVPYEEGFIEATFSVSSGITVLRHHEFSSGRFYCLDAIVGFPGMTQDESLPIIASLVETQQSEVYHR